MRLFFGILSIIPAALAYFLYFRSIFAGKTKPHAYSWLIWATLAGIGWYTQFRASAGFGAWATGVTSVMSMIIFVVAAYRGDTKPTSIDKTLLALAMTALGSLILVDNKQVALWITLFALSIGFYITSNKAWRLPREENATSFALNGLKFMPAMFALSSVSFMTLAYPLVATIGNFVVATVVIMRKRQI